MAASQTVVGTVARLHTLLDSELNFHEETSSYATHTIHAFAAKFPPQLPRTFIKSLTAPGEIVLDPMMGSGTAIVEAMILRRRGIGFDIDPLALRLARVKTTHLPKKVILERGGMILLRARQLLLKRERIYRELETRFDTASRKFIDYWFLPQTQEQLMALLMAIEEEKVAAIRAFFEVIFSSIIVTKSGGVSLARDLAHSRPHRDDSKRIRAAVQQFQIRLEQVAGTLAYIPSNGLKPFIRKADARDLPLSSNSVHLVVTSPPYANAIDYMRAHKFSLVWLGKASKKLTQLRSRYIGTEALKRSESLVELPKFASKQVEQLERKDKRKAALLQQYFLDMRRVLSEMRRVLQPGRACALVVGPSTMRGIRIETHQALAEIGEQVGFILVDVAARELDRDRRMMPVRSGPSVNRGIELRVHQEFVIGWVKPY